MPTIRISARFTVRATTTLDVTDDELETIKADPELNVDDVLDKFCPTWKDDEWDERHVFMIQDLEADKPILEPA